MCVCLCVIEPITTLGRVRQKEVDGERCHRQGDGSGNDSIGKEQETVAETPADRREGNRRKKDKLKSQRSINYWQQFFCNALLSQLCLYERVELKDNFMSCIP